MSCIHPHTYTPVATMQSAKLHTGSRLEGGTPLATMVLAQQGNVKAHCQNVDVLSASQVSFTLYSTCFIMEVGQIMNVISSH